MRPMSYKRTKNTKGLPPQVWWITLLDSSLDGNLLFITKLKLNNIPNEKKNPAETWQTSNGTFTTTYLDNLEIMCPAFSKSKISSVHPDIFIVDESDGEPMFDLILCVEHVAEFGTVLDFQDKTIQSDNTKITMRRGKLPRKK